MNFIFRYGNKMAIPQLSPWSPLGRIQGGVENTVSGKTLPFTKRVMLK